MSDRERPLDENPLSKYLKKPGVTNPLFAILRGILGAIAGGTLGHFAFEWLTTQGFYSLVLPGALLGLGFGLASRFRSNTCGIFCAIAAVLLGFFSEWNSFPFLKDESFFYFLKHLNQLKPLTMIMIGLGALLSFWFGRGR
jgi:hypothetical protein